MAGTYEFYYTRPGRDPGTDEQTLLTAGVTFLGMAGAGMANLEPATAQQVNEHGETFVGEQPYWPSRTITVSVQVTGASASQFIQRMAALYEKITPFTRRNLLLGTFPLGRLRVVRPDAIVRCLDCILTADPEDSEIKNSPVTAKRHLTFWAPNPTWYDPVMTLEYFGYDEATWPGGFVSPIASRADTSLPGIVCSPEKTVLQAMLDYPGTARAWPVLYVVGPAHGLTMMRYNPADPQNSEYVELPYDLLTGDVMAYDMATGIASIDRAATGLTEELRQMTQDSVRWQLENGINIIYVAANGLDFDAATCVGYYARYTGVSGGEL